MCVCVSGRDVCGVCVCACGRDVCVCVCVCAGGMCGVQTVLFRDACRFLGLIRSSIKVL
jgi:hypothetical protein